MEQAKSGQGTQIALFFSAAFGAMQFALQFRGIHNVEYDNRLTPCRVQTVAELAKVRKPEIRRIQRLKQAQLNSMSMRLFVVVPERLLDRQRNTEPIPVGTKAATVDVHEDRIRDRNRHALTPCWAKHRTHLQPFLILVHSIGDERRRINMFGVRRLVAAFFLQYVCQLDRRRIFGPY
jgi:hypothetical protein